MKKGLFIITVLAMLSACAQKNTNSNKLIVGNDKDSHGCIGSAGYIWSEVRGECVRLFEIGVPMTSVNNETENAYIVLSQDSSKLELFFTNKEKSLVLNRNGDLNWSIDKDNMLKVLYKNNIWSITLDGQVKYKQIK